MNSTSWKKFLLGTGFLASLALTPSLLLGCAGTVAYSNAGYNDDDDYVYYPDYGIYYGARHHQYVYMEGSTWTRGDAPSHVPVNELSASQSVQMDFHDAPEHHHSEVIGKYPGHPHPNGNGDDHGGPGNDHHN